MNPYQNYGYTEGNAFLARFSFSGTPLNGTVLPAASTSKTQTFTYTFTHSVGSASISNVWALTQNGIKTTNACFWQYNAVKNEFSLLDDAASTYLGPISPQSGATLQNSSCTIGGPGTSVTGIGNTLTIVLPITASSYFNGAHNIYLYSRDIYAKEVVGTSKERGICRW